MDEQLRQTVRERADHRCEDWCLPQDAEPFFVYHVEHLVARQHGGSDDNENLALACYHCNAHKGPNLSALDPENGALVRLFNPRLDKWEEHFERNESPFWRTNRVRPSDSRAIENERRGSATTSRTIGLLHFYKMEKYGESTAHTCFKQKFIMKEWYFGQASTRLPFPPSGQSTPFLAIKVKEKRLLPDRFWAEALWMQPALRTNRETPRDRIRCGRKYTDPTG